MNTFIDDTLGTFYYQGALVAPARVNYDKNKIDLAFQAFEDEKISLQQKELYGFVTRNYDKIISATKNRLADMASKIKIHTLFFDRFNAYGFLGDMKDDEHGIAVKFIGEHFQPQIGLQDILI